MDPITAQIALNTVLDHVWPILPPYVLAQLQYV